MVEKEIFLIHIGLGFSSCAGFHMTSDSGESDRAGNSYNTTGGDADTPTLVSLSQKSLPFGTKDFIDQVCDSRAGHDIAFSAVITRSLRWLRYITNAHGDAHGAYCFLEPTSVELRSLIRRNLVPP